MAAHRSDQKRNGGKKPALKRVSPKEKRARWRKLRRLERNAQISAFVVTMIVCVCLGLLVYFKGADHVPGMVGNIEISEGKQTAEMETAGSAEELTKKGSEIVAAATVEATPEPVSKSRETIVRALSAGANNMAVVKKGVSVITGENTHAQCDNDDWPKVVSVALGNDHAVGLTEAGSVVYSGSDEQRQCELDIGDGVVRSVAAGPYASYAVMDDGTIRVSGSTEAPLEKLREIKDAVDISAAQTHVLVLKEDGTVAAYGDASTGACAVGEWHDIVMISCGYAFSLGLDKQGQVWFAGNGRQGRKDIAQVNDAIAISAGSLACYAVHQDGTVTATGSNGNGQLEVNDWQDVVSVAGGYLYGAALTQTGELLIAGTDPAFK